jgi:peroxiredoxin Q/BCP
VTDGVPVLEQIVPDFTAQMTGEREFVLSDYQGKILVLYFYPKDNTPGCTMESLHFRDLYLKFQKADTEIFGISRDSLRSHQNFKAKLDLPFELITDPDETLCTRFNVMKSKMMYGKKVRGIERSTFIIDAEGKLMKEWRGLKVPGHVDEILSFVQAIA